MFGYINFISTSDPDANWGKYQWVKARKGDNIQKIANRYLAHNQAGAIVNLNLGRDVLPHPKRKPHHSVPRVPKLTNAKQPLRAGASIKLPGTIAPAGFFFRVRCGDKPPVVKKGYSNWDKVTVPGRTGINRFVDYDPIELEISIQFEAFGNDPDDSTSPGYILAQGSIEDRITTLERMAGRGTYPGAGYGPPAVVAVNTTDDREQLIPLIPMMYQHDPVKNPNAPLFRVTGLTWEDSADTLRNDAGYRVRQRATVILTQYTPLQFSARSLSQRNAAASKKPGSKKPPAKKKSTKTK